MHLALDVATFSRFRLYRNSIRRCIGMAGCRRRVDSDGRFLTLELINSADASRSGDNLIAPRSRANPCRMKAPARHSLAVCSGSPYKHSKLIRTARRHIR